MKKKVLLIAFFTLLVLRVSAQVTIGSGLEPLSGAILDLKERESHNADTSTKGIVLPRVSLQNVNSLEPLSTSTGVAATYYRGATVYNVNATSPLSDGIYVWNGAKWIKVGEDSGSSGTSAPSYFYLPSFNIQPSIAQKTIDMYNDVYVKNFSRQTSWISSDGGTGSTNPIGGTLYDRAKLEFIVTYYDPALFSSFTMLTGANAGKLTYSTYSDDPSTTSSYINVIVVVKP
ncbi:hypothetical protein M2459_003484 [Parabacteroides sp. PF5-5]|uniref:hypothetical protein n=1 Tax=unclassified Parabacteroides TaxID=2649774 RepID=UPI00247623A8|nr:MULTISPECIES: hypothetical protein [unclassified Parabacteroides]MDH6306889.1 hypothetical protein [Parabacteroides sp. PH5-39]MDH6317723.1 hypothetical protein [Parabacteroides sp. PF5-13]MDH6321595.1 hypothetical protein [Parabacteroides sp. PH5-13]MDH6325276.1 hypothetical protein [Parabacteroides sp. PH5-8]MDH6328908.1 hypothetical protein [Parabacteroides sp. PH5-41]